jgi:CDGSH-type Zn-finger protein
MKSNLHPRAGMRSYGYLLIALFLFCGCGTTETKPHLDPEFGQCVKAGFEAQALNPNAPADHAPADSLPGDLANQIYKKRYIKTMTEEKKEKDDTASELSGLD